MAIKKRPVEARDPSEETSEFAAFWLHLLQRSCANAAIGFTVPHQKQNELGEWIYEWTKVQPPKKLLRVFIEGDEATYQRLWGGEDGRKYYADGECTHTDMARLLIEWLGY